MSYSSERLDRIERIVESNARAIEATNEREEIARTELRQFIRSNARAIEAVNQREAEAREELRQSIQSNARSIQAIGQELRQGIQSNQELLTRINETKEGLARRFASLDEDRPTILWRLNSIEQKLDQIIDQNNNQ